MSDLSRVLMIDDDVVLGHAIARVLKGRCEFRVVHDPRVALALIDEGERFDVILCDMNLPFMGGEELHRALSARAPAQAARIVFFSGDDPDPALLARTGAGFLTKPFKLPQLFALVSESPRLERYSTCA